MVFCLSERETMFFIDLTLRCYCWNCDVRVLDAGCQKFMDLPFDLSFYKDGRESSEWVQNVNLCDSQNLIIQSIILWWRASLRPPVVGVNKLHLFHLEYVQLLWCFQTNLFKRNRTNILPISELIP